MIFIQLKRLRNAAWSGSKALLFALLAALVFNINALAHNKAVVIPMAGDDIMPEPTAPLAKNSPPDSDYTQNADTVVDNITGLEWQHLPPVDVDPVSEGNQSTGNWDTVWAYCAGLNLGGKTDWRLPLVHELQSIVDYDSFNPAINQVIFPSTITSRHWSASNYADFSIGAWLVNFMNGNVVAAGKNIWAYVRCVR